MEIIRSSKVEDLQMDAFLEFVSVAKTEMTKREIQELKEKMVRSMDANEELELAKKILDLKKGCVGNG